MTASVSRSSDDELNEPIIILGAPRSGTSVLAEIMAAHPDVALVQEPRLVWRYGNDGCSDQLRRKHATPDVVHHIHRSFAKVLRERGAKRLLEKTPANAVRPQFVDAVFPNARYLHITRNGWAAVPSISAFWGRRAVGFDERQVRKLRRRLAEARPRQWRHYASEATRRMNPRTRHTPLYGPRLAGLQSIVDELGRLEAAALQWKTCVEQSTTFGRHLPHGRYLEVHLECLDAEMTAALLDFCGLSPSDRVVRKFAELYRRDKSTRMPHLSDEERQLLAPYVLPTNAWLGYPTPCVIEFEP